MQLASVSKLLTCSVVTGMNRIEFSPAKER